MCSRSSAQMKHIWSTFSAYAPLSAYALYFGKGRFILWGKMHFHPETFGPLKKVKNTHYIIPSILIRATCSQIDKLQLLVK
jgi:hypothetical protein